MRYIYFLKCRTFIENSDKIKWMFFFLQLISECVVIKGPDHMSVYTQDEYNKHNFNCISSVLYMLQLYNWNGQEKGKVWFDENLEETCCLLWLGFLKFLVCFQFKICIQTPLVYSFNTMVSPHINLWNLNELH